MNNFLKSQTNIADINFIRDFEFCADNSALMSKLEQKRESNSSHNAHNITTVSINDGEIMLKENYTTKLCPINGRQINQLFKGLFCDDIDSDKLFNGQYWNDFYENTYSKYNNLDHRQANKRKKVCKKLFHIMKILVKFLLTLVTFR